MKKYVITEDLLATLRELPMSNWLRNKLEDLTPIESMSSEAVKQTVIRVADDQWGSDSIVDWTEADELFYGVFVRSVERHLIGDPSL